MSGRLSHDEILTGLRDLPDWVAVGGALHARFDPPSVPAAAALLTEVLVAAEEQDHHPDVDLRWRRLRFRVSSHDVGGVTGRDLRLAATISSLAAAHVARPMAAAPTVLELGIVTPDPAGVLPFWRALLQGWREQGGDGFTVFTDPEGGPDVWIDRSDAPPDGRNRLHLDVSVPTLEDAAARRSAVEEAGGRLVTDEFAPAWWVYADADGNEACICTPFGRT